MNNNGDSINENAQNNEIINSTESIIVNEDTTNISDNSIPEKKKRITKKTKVIAIAVLASIVAIVIFSFVFTYLSHPLTGRWKCSSVDSADSTVMLSDCIYDFSMYGDFTIEYPEEFEESENRIIKGNYYMHNDNVILEYNGYSLEYKYKKDGNVLLLTREIKNTDTSMFKLRDTVKYNMAFYSL